MKTLIATATLTVMFLSAGAFAGGAHPGLADATLYNPANLTVIAKNAAWPAAGHITVEPCKVSRCIDI